MATTNPVNQVLVTSGNVALIAAGSRPDALAVGQLGVFNFHTGLSVDGSVPADCRDIFLAVGVDPLATGSITDVNRSSGQMIQVRNMRALTYRGTVGELPKIVDISIPQVKCETDYAIKFMLRNGQIYAENGYNQFAKTYAVKTSCCADACEDCADGDCMEVADSIVTQINADPDALLTATYVVNKITATVAAEPTAAGDIVVTVGSTAYTVAIVDADTVTTAAAKIVTKINTQTDSPYWASSALGVISIYPKVSSNDSTETLVYTTPVAGMTITPIVAATKTAVTVANRDAFVTANPGVCLSIRVTSAAVPKSSYNGSINLKYVKNRMTDFDVSFPVGFECNASDLADTIQEAQASEGNGYDLKQIEYEAGGFNGRPGPYRQSTVTGMERAGFLYYVSATANYNIFELVYDQQSVGGWLEYLNNLQTTLAVPCADTTTTTSIGAIFALIFTQFGTMADDIAANDGCSNVQTTALVAATDGIESISS